MPNYELRLLNDTTMRRWASEFARANKRGVPILLRFAHEMNGAWINYGMKPTQFIPAWRKFASIVHAATNLTAMMWAPNVGEGYPYEKSVYTPEPGTPDFLLLDSNKDGSLDPLDDPYSPYWPGSEYVDWVATSLYWTGGSWPGIVNTPPPPDHVGPTIEGNSTANINQGQAQYDFNAMFSVKYGKPMALGESGVSFYRTTAAGDVVDPGIGELAIKRAWWRQTFNHTLHTAFPRLKGIVHFDVKKDDGRGAVDYTITEGVALPEYRKEMEGVPLTWADKVLAWQCDGTVALA
ncbi:glycoside hydrolase superfamily [Hyaloraphidium curvatum]|nr:glycoside hydrolase superfamily [Hyaloraphidium curvatum]